MSKQMTFRARQRKLKRKIRNEEWSRLKQNHKTINLSEVWNLEVYAAKYIAPRLKLLKNTIASEECAPAILGDDGFPSSMVSLATGDDNHERWQAMLNEMLFAFEYYSDLYNRRWNATDEEKARVKEGLRLFAEWYDYLWY